MEAGDNANSHLSLLHHKMMVRNEIFHTILFAEVVALSMSKASPWLFVLLSSYDLFHLITKICELEDFLRPMEAIMGVGGYSKRWFEYSKFMKIFTHVYISIEVLTAFYSTIRATQKYCYSSIV